MQGILAPNQAIAFLISSIFVATWFGCCRKIIRRWIFAQHTSGRLDVISLHHLHDLIIYRMVPIIPVLPLTTFL